MSDQTQDRGRRIRIKGVGEKSVHAWYARHVGDVFEVVDYQEGRPGHYTVIILSTPSPQYGYVAETDAEIIAPRTGKE